ncbi:HAD family hydrolase [Ktedonosporobacter rubrisoli]|nr:Cof-type HAD-IIB family hydrolase [Ktedonosporobacter rubrisoli]
MQTQLSQPIKLLAIDIDGTLLTPQKHIAPRTLEAISKAQQEGVIVTLATARRYWNTAPIATELGIAIPIILYDGAIIIQHPEGTVTYKNLLPSHIAQRAVDLMVQHGVQPVLHHIVGTREEVWTGPAEYDNDWVNDYLNTTEGPLRRLPYDVCATGQPDPIRVVAFTTEAIVEAMKPALVDLQCSWNSIPSGSYHTAELAIMHAGCTKASGVKALAQHLGIPAEQTMAIGDNNNDIEMLQATGWGVAMGQAPEEVKAAANAITGSNTEDGVAQAIERYILGSERQASSNSLSREIWR